MGIRKAAVEPELQRTEEEPKGRSSLTEPEEWSPEAKHGQRQTKAAPEGRGSLAGPVD